MKKLSALLKVLTISSSLLIAIFFLFQIKTAKAVIAAPSITVLSPNGGEKLIAGQVQDITWRASGIGKVNITLTKYAASSTIDSQIAVNIAASSFGKYSWSIPKTASGEKYKISISGNGKTDRSDNYFSIVSATTFPLPTVDLKINRSDGQLTKAPGYATFSWTSTNADYCTASGDTYWSGSKSTSGSETVWTGNEKTGLTNYSLTCGASSGKVSSVNDSVTVLFLSSPSITVLSPNGGEQWVAGKTYGIKWNYSGEDRKVAIQLEKWSPDRKQVSVSGIKEAQISWRIYFWSIPENQAVGSYYKINIVNIDGTPLGGYAPVDSSDNYFSIIKNDPIVNWQTYTNTKEGFEVKYPENFYVFNVDSGSTKFYINHRRFSVGFRDSKLKDNPAGGSAFYISIYENFNGELRNWMIDNSSPFEFGTAEYTQSRKLYYNSSNAQPSEANINGIKVLNFDLIGGYPTDETVALLKNGSDLFEILYQKTGGQTNIFNQILSTFKFSTVSANLVLPTTCVDKPEGVSVITSLSNYSGSIGARIEIRGCNFSGFEGDKNAWIENSQGVRGVLYGEQGSTAKVIKVTLKSPLCSQDNSYSGLPCNSYLTLTPGTYKIWTMPWGKKSNEVNLTIK